MYTVLKGKFRVKSGYGIFWVADGDLTEQNPPSCRYWIFRLYCREHLVRKNKRKTYVHSLCHLLPLMGGSGRSLSRGRWHCLEIVVHAYKQNITDTIKLCLIFYHWIFSCFSFWYAAMSISYMCCGSGPDQHISSYDFLGLKFCNFFNFIYLPL